MPDLGNAVLTLRVAGDKFKQGLNSARKQTGDFAAKSEKQVGRVRGAFGKLGTGIKGAAGQVPILGGAMTALANPVTAIAVGVGAVAVALGKMVGRIVDAEKALRPMVERSGIASDNLQLLAKAAEVAGSEDGLEGVTDSAQELQLRLAEVVQDGTGPAVEAFKKLGLSAEDLIDKSPEESFLAVVSALQNVTNEADRKFLADELLGGSSEKLAGLLNLTNEELGNQLQHLADTGDFMSGEALADAKAYSASIDVLKNSFGSMATQIGSVLIPILTGLVESLNFIGKGLDWVGETLGFAKDDTNEFTEAADEMSETLAQGAAPAFEATTEAAEDATVEIAEVGKASQITTKSVETLSTATEEVTEGTKLWAAANRASSQQMIEDSALRLTNLLADYQKELVAMREVDDARKTAIDWIEEWRVRTLKGSQANDIASLSLGGLRTGYSNVSDEVDPLAALIAEMTQKVEDATAAEELQAAALAALPPELRAAAAAMGLFGLSIDGVTSSLNAATSAQARFDQSQRDAANDASGNPALTNVHQGGGRTSGRFAGNAHNRGTGEITGVREVGGGLFFTTSEDGGTEFNADRSGRLDEARQFQNDNPPAAQHGAAVRGSRYGSLVRVGENFTNENIVPVGRSGGMGGGGSAPLYLSVKFGDTEVENVLVGKLDDLYRQRRINVDLTSS